MNNAFVRNKEPEKIDRTPWLKQQEVELLKIIEAIQNIKQSNFWKTLKEKVFDGVVISIQEKLQDEKDEKELYRLQGQMAWASKFTDLDKLEKVYRDQLEAIRNNYVKKDE